MIPTGEVPITNIMRDKIVKESDLPIKFVGHTPSFRSEAGAYGPPIILCTNTCMLVYLVLLHMQYYATIPVC